MPAERPIPKGAENDTIQHDHAWVQSNMVPLLVLSSQSFHEFGRGILIVNPATFSSEAKEPSYSYLTLEAVEQNVNDDTEPTENEFDPVRLLKEYDPDKECIILLLNPERTSRTYRVDLQLDEPKADSQQ